MDVIDWLLASDPAIRWQVRRDLLDALPAEVEAERAKVATEGWGAELLAQQRPDGSWGGVAFNQGYDSTMHVLTLLHLFGIDPDSLQARAAIERVRERVIWPGWGPDGTDNPYFEGEVEPCINGQVAAAGAYFRQDVSGLIDRLVSEQLDDGGWNCEAENGSVRGSFNTTICVLEALLSYERAFGGRDEATAARVRGQEYLLDRQLFKRLSTGEAILIDRKRGGNWTEFAFPTWWHYDVMRGLDYLRAAGVSPHEQVADAIELVRSKRQPDGRWLLDMQYPGAMLVDLGEVAGEPSQWMTLRALRVLRWYEGGFGEAGLRGERSLHFGRDDEKLSPCAK
ncbi:MAG TPA: hypothetical protein VFP05_15905 [Thermomicrobiales bacterium]|nr:hypothetical protein [Thermomicrobiales bacterium]